MSGWVRTPPSGPEIEIVAGEPWFVMPLPIYDDEDVSPLGWTDGTYLEATYILDDTVADLSGCQTHFGGMGQLLQTDRCILERHHESPHLRASRDTSPQVIVRDLVITSPLR